MKSAVCLYGVVGGIEGKNGSGGNIPFEKCYETYKKHIIDVNNADVFIHSWSIDVEDSLVNLYKPNKYKIQEQIPFEYKIIPENKRLREIHKDQGYRSLSKWYSLKKVIELKKEYEFEHGFEYDCVMLTRFDTLFFVDLDFSKCDLTCLCVPHFNNPDGLGHNLTIKPDRINMSETRYGFSDMWYLSNSKIIDEFIKIYSGVDSGKYRISQHKAAWDLFFGLGYDRSFFRYYLYRHYDFELYRWVIGNLFSKGDRNGSKK